MKKIFLLISFVFSLNAFAQTSLICNDQNSHSVYRVELDEDSGALLTPLLPDSSLLSHSAAYLEYNLYERVFMGKNKNNNRIVLDINLEQVNEGGIVEITASYSLNGTNVIDQATTFLCSVE